MALTELGIDDIHSARHLLHYERSLTRQTMPLTLTWKVVKRKNPGHWISLTFYVVKRKIPGNRIDVDNFLRGALIVKHKNYRHWMTV